MPDLNYFDPSKLTESEGIEDEIILTPEDETNPELLAELESLHIGPKPNSISEMSEQELEQCVKELKAKALSCKRSGDLEGAKATLIELHAHEKQLHQLQSLRIAIESTKASQRFLGACAGDAIFKESFLSPNSSTLSSPAELASPLPPSSPKLKDASVYRDLFARLQKQSAQCAAIAESYAQVNRHTDAKLFMKRKQAFDLDVLKLRSMLRDKQTPPDSQIVDVIYELQLCNSDVPEGCLQITLGDLKITNSRKCKLKADGEQYEFRLFYDLPGLDETETTLYSAPFTTTGLERNSLPPFLFKCSRKDIRVVKAVEYKKMRLEIVSQEGFLFFKSKVAKMSGQIKLDRLLKDCTLQVPVDLMDVDGDKRSSLPSAQILLTARVRNPLSLGSVATKQVTERWTVIPSFGNSNHVLYSCLPPPEQPKSPVVAVVPQVSLPEVATTGTIADKIKSFDVIEYELDVLARKKSEVMTDPQLMDLQVALEGLRDRLQMQVEIGQLSITGKCYND